MPTRRRTLAVAAASLSAVAGCGSGSVPHEGLPDVVLSNLTDGTVRVTVVADSGRDDRPPYLSETTTLDPDGRTEYDDPIPDGVEPPVSVENGPRNARRWPGEGAEAKQFHVEIRADSVEFVVGER